MADTPTRGVNRPPPPPPIDPPQETQPTYVLVAYEPWGAERGEVAYYQSASFTRNWLDTSTTTIVHSEIGSVPASRAPDGTFSVFDENARLAYAEDLARLKAGRWRWYMLDDDQQRIPLAGGTFIPSGQSEDRLDPTKSNTYNGVGIDVLFYTARLADPTNQGDPETGAKQPVYQYTASSIMTAGRMIQSRLVAAQARVSTNGLLWGEGFRWEFTLADDSFGNPWTWVLEQDKEFPAEASIGDLLDWLTEQGAIDWWTEPHNDDEKEWLVIVNAGSSLTDRSVRDVSTYVELVDSAALTAPETKDFTKQATDAFVVGDNGIYGWAVDDFATEDTSPFGRIEIPVSAPGLIDPDGIQSAARGPLRAGRRALESITRSLAAVSPGAPWVDIDFDLGDNLAVQRGSDSEAADDDELMRSLQIISAKIDLTPDSLILAEYTFNSREEQAVARITRQLARATVGKQGAVGGEPRKPDPDPRKPLAPTNLGATITYDLVGSETRATLATTGDPVLYAPSIRDPAILEEIEIKEYVHYRKRTGAGQIKEFARTPVSQGTSVTFGNEAHWDTRTNWLYYRSAVSHAGKESDLSSAVTVTLTTDTEPVEGPSRIRDGGFQSAVINAKRTTDAGAGFSFVAASGKNWADFTTTTPELNLSVAELAGRGRVQVIEQEWYRLKATAYRTGLSAASVQGRIKWLDKDGTQIGSISTVFTSAVTGSAAEYADIVQAPALAVRAEVRIKGASFTGTGSLRVADVDLTRRIEEKHVNDLAITEVKHADNSVSNRTVITDTVDARTITAAPLTTKHTATGTLLQASALTSGFKHTTSGSFFYVGGVAVVSFAAGGIYLKGVIETSSGLIMGGAGLADIQFASGYTIGTTGGYLEFNAGGSGFKFNGAGLFSTAVTISGSTQTAGLNNTGTGRVCGSGFTLGFFGSIGTTKQATVLKVLGAGAAADAIRSIAQILDGHGLLTNQIT